MSNDIIYNWTNSLKSGWEGQRIVAAHTARELKAEGYSHQDALDLLIARDGIDVSLAEEIARDTFAAAPAKSVRMASAPQAAVVATSYKDMKPTIEETLHSISARKFVDRLTLSEAPLVRGLSASAVGSLVRLASDAKKKDKYALAELHTRLRPFLEDAQFGSVLLAEKIEAHARPLTRDASRFAVTVATRLAAEKDYTVDLGQGTCNCYHFVKSNMGDFGLACEHMIKTADAVSPHTRLMRALRTAEDLAEDLQDDESETDTHPSDGHHAEAKSGKKKKDSNPCWDGYKKTPGKDDYEPGSCEKVSSTKFRKLAQYGGPGDFAVQDNGLSHADEMNADRYDSTESLMQDAYAAGEAVARTQPDDFSTDEEYAQAKSAVEDAVWKVLEKAGPNHVQNVGKLAEDIVQHIFDDGLFNGGVTDFGRGGERAQEYTTGYGDDEGPEDY